MIENQAYVFLCTILIGAVLGIVFDFFRILRRKGNTKNILVYLQDILFWMIVTLVVIISTFLINDGELRGFMILGYILGGIFYLLLFSKWIRKIFSCILDMIEKVFKLICNKIVQIGGKIKILSKNDKKVKN